MKKMKKSVKTAVVSTLVLSSTAAIAYAGSTISNKKNADLENSLKLLVEQKDSDTVKVAIDNVKDIAKSMQFSIKLDGAKLADGENSIKDLVKSEVLARTNNINGTTNVITDYTYNDEKNTIDVLITSDNSLPKTGDKIDIFELDVKAEDNTEKADGDAPTFKIIPNNEESYKYVTNTNKEYNKIGVTYDDKQTIVMNSAPTIESNGKYIEILEGDTLSLTADELGLTLDDKDGTDGLKLEVKVKDSSDAITEFTESTPGIYELVCVAIDKYNTKSEPVTVQVNVKADVVTESPIITTKDGGELQDIVLRAGQEFKPLDNVKAIDAKGRELQVEVSTNEEINFDPEEDTNYILTYKAKDRYGNIGKKEVRLTILANAAPVIKGVRDHKLAIGDSFDPRAGVKVMDEDENIELRVESNVNTKIVGTYQVSYSATDSAGKTTRAISKVVVNPKPSLINRAPVIFAENRTLTQGDVFNALEGVTAEDKEDGILTHKIEVLEDNVDTSKPGKYTVKYSVTDSKGTTTTKKITVVVLQKIEAINHIPEIKANDKTIKLGDEFKPLEGVSAYDYEDEDITSSIQVVYNNVDSSKEGQYKVKYSVSDSEGATVTKEITVTVKKDIILAESITINNKTYNKMYLDNTKIISATINEEADIKDIAWTIDNENIASLEIVGNEAKIVAKAKGKVTITASTKDESNKNDSMTIDIIDFKNDDELPSYIKDVIDTNILLPIAGAGTGEENSPIEFEVKNITASEVERLLEDLEDLSPVLEEIREENNSKIYKIKLTKKAGLFRSNDEIYIEIRVSNKLDNASEINKILAQLASEETDKPGAGDESGSEETDKPGTGDNSDSEDSVAEGNLKTGDTGILGYIGVAAVAGASLLLGKKRKNR